MKKIIISSLFFMSTLASAATAPQTFTYQGKLMNAAGTAPLSGVISLKLDILDPSGACTLYEETQSNIDLSQTNGLFSVQVGSGLADVPNKRTSSVDQGLTMSQVFANNGAFTIVNTSSCSAGYTPAAGDGRLLRVSVTSGGSTTTITPDLKIGSVPNSMVAETLQGLKPTNLLYSSTTATNGDRIERAKFAGATDESRCTASPCSLYRMSGNWVSAVNRVGVGQYSLSIAPGTFSQAPVCTCTALAAAVDARTSCSIEGLSTTGGAFYAFLSNGSFTDAEVYLTCMGPR